MIEIDKKGIEKFEDLISLNVDNGCWEWKGYRNRFGYGVMSIGRRGSNKKIRAHRISYELFRGIIPEGKIVMHQCDNPPCVNPFHLGIGTKKDNSQDMISKGRGKGHFLKNVRDERSNLGSYNLKKKYCPKGHPYFGENLFVRKNGKRECKECLRTRPRELRKKKRSLCISSSS